MLERLERGQENQKKRRKLRDDGCNKKPMLAERMTSGEEVKRELLAFVLQKLILNDWLIYVDNLLF